MAITASVAAQKMVGFLTDTNTGVNPAVVQLANDTGVALAPIPAAPGGQSKRAVRAGGEGGGGEVSGDVRVHGPGAKPADGEIPQLFRKSAHGDGSEGIARPH